MSTLQKRTLKIGVFTSPQSGNEQFERYIIENDKDLILFFKAFPNNPKSQRMNWISDLNAGRIILATDPHHLTKLNTYCFEAVQPKENPHPSDFIRVTNIN